MRKIYLMFMVLMLACTVMASANTNEKKFGFTIGTASLLPTSMITDSALVLLVPGPVLAAMAEMTQNPALKTMTGPVVSVNTKLPTFDEENMALSVAVACNLTAPGITPKCRSDGGYSTID